jgi:hypothetical protein
MPNAPKFLVSEPSRFDGNRYDIKLDKAFNIVSKRRDYL